MSDQPAPTTANEPDLFDLAAQLAGCDPVDLIKVRRDPAGLVVILSTGQKFIFNTAALGPQIDAAIRAQLAQVLGQPIDPAPAAAAPSEALPAAGKAKSRRAA